MSNTAEAAPKKSFIRENWFLLFAVIYVLSPIDLIPETLVPLIGSVDDAGVVLIELMRQYRNFSKGE